MNENYHENYQLMKFTDTNFTKPIKIKLTVETYHDVITTLNEVRFELAVLEANQTGLTDILFYLMAEKVEEHLRKYESKTRYLGFQSTFEISMPIHLCVFLADFLTIENRIYSTTVRIFSGMLDSILSKNDFSKVYTYTYQNAFDTHITKTIEVSIPSKMNVSIDAVN